MTKPQDVLPDKCLCLSLCMHGIEQCGMHQCANLLCKIAGVQPSSMNINATFVLLYWPMLDMTRIDSTV